MWLKVALRFPHSRRTSCYWDQHLEIWATEHESFCSLRNTRLSPVWGQSSLQKSVEGRAFGNRILWTLFNGFLQYLCARKSSFKPVSQLLEPDLVIDKFCISNWQLMYFFSKHGKLFSNCFLFIINHLRRSNLFAVELLLQGKAYV